MNVAVDEDTYGFEEEFEGIAGFFVEETGHATSETANGGLCSTCERSERKPSVKGSATYLDVVTENLAVSLCAALSETLSTLSMPRRIC